MTSNPRFGVGTELGSQDAVRQLTWGHEICSAATGRPLAAVTGHAEAGHSRTEVEAGMKKAARYPEDG